nr:CcdB family protein [Roseicyclus mahoneyensis]
MQTDLIAAIGTRLVAPMLPVAELPQMPALMPRVLFAETRRVVVIPQIGSVPEAALLNPIGTLPPSATRSRAPSTC